MEKKSLSVFLRCKSAHRSHRTGFPPHQCCRCKHTCSSHRCWNTEQDRHTSPPWPCTRPNLSNRDPLDHTSTTTFISHQMLPVLLICLIKSRKFNKTMFTINFHCLDVTIIADSGQIVSDVPVGGVTGHRHPELLRATLGRRLSFSPTDVVELVCEAWFQNIIQLKRKQRLQWTVTGLGQRSSVGLQLTCLRPSPLFVLQSTETLNRLYPADPDKHVFLNKQKQSKAMTQKTMEVSYLEDWKSHLQGDKQCE